MKNLFDILDKEIKENGNGSSDKIGFTKFEEGNTHITVLGAADPRWTHYVDIPQKLTLNCTGMDQCPICKIIAAQKAAGIDPDYKATKKFGMLVYNHNTSELEIVDQKITFMKNFHAMLEELRDDGEDFNPSENVTRIRRTGKGFNDTTYTFKPAPKADQKPVPEEILKRAADIVVDELFLSITSDQIKLLLSGKTLKEIFNPEGGEVSADAPVVDFTK